MRFWNMRDEKTQKSLHNIRRVFVALIHKVGPYIKFLGKNTSSPIRQIRMHVLQAELSAQTRRLFLFFFSS